MSKKIKVVLFIIGIILLSILIFFVFFNKSTVTPIVKNNSSEQNTPSTTNSSSQKSTPAFSVPEKNSPTMSLSTTQGEIKTNNLYQNPVQIFAPDNIAMTEVLFGKNDDFSTSFFPQDQGFLITLLNSDLEKARTEAEGYFLQKLNITQSQACALKVTLNTPAFINQKAAGTNFGLSFCPNGKPLPKQ